MHTTLVFLITLAAAPVFAQTTPSMQWSELMEQMSRDSVNAFTQGMNAGTAARNADLRQKELNLARERFEWEKQQAAQSAALRDRVLDANFGYRAAHPGVADWRVNQDVLDAFKAARAAHPDFDDLQPLMRIVAEALRPDWTRLTMTEYIECLYDIAKSATFAAPARDKLASLKGAAK